MNTKNVYWTIGIIAVILVLALAFFLPRKSPSPSRKPLTTKNVTLAPEVKKYTEEPVITVFRHATNTTQKMPLEKYLEGVVAAEVGPKPPAEALKAQAITARSLTMAKILYTGGVKKLHNTEACDLPEHFQAYDEKAVTPQITAAVKSTRGQLILYKGKFAYALFSSYAGKKTASLSESFPDLIKIANPYIKVLASPGAKYAPANEKYWTASIPKSELQNIFGPDAKIDGIIITKKGPSGRAIDITAGIKTVKGYDLRSRLGGQRLRSTLITSIKVQGDKVVFKGEGWGHGCGMSQWGAFEMAKNGKTATQILTYYFPNTQVVKVWK